MGLDTSHECWHGGYIGFTMWRNELARAAGYKIAGPSVADDIYSPQPDLHWDAFEDENFTGEWGSLPGDDPLLFLLVHSDCDGVIHPQHGLHLARRLEHLLPLLSDSESSRDIDWLQAKTRQFIDGLKAAAAAGEDVIFA